MATNLVFAQAEKISKMLPEWMGSMDVVSNKIKRKATVEKVGERDFRVPYLTTDGGRVGYFDPNGGSYGRGTYGEGGVMIQTIYPFSFRHEIPLLAAEATKEKQISNLNAFNRATEKMVENFPKFLDRVWHRADGTPQLGTATDHTTSGGNSVYTMDPSTGVMAFRRGEYYAIYSNDQTTIRADGPYKLIAIDYQANKLTFSGAVTAAGTTDKILFEGVSGASPAGPHGLPYHNNTALSGLTHGVNRANEPEIIPSLIDLAGGVPTFQKGLQMANKIGKRRGSKGVPPGTEILCSPEQQANIRKQVQDIANFDLSKGKMNADLMPTPDSTFMFCGVPANLDNVQNTTRLDYVNFSEWEIMEITPIGFITDSNGNKFFLTYDTSGAPQANEWFGMRAIRNWICTNPGAGGVMYDAAQPSY